MKYLFYAFRIHKVIRTDSTVFQIAFNYNLEYQIKVVQGSKVGLEFNGLIHSLVLVMALFFLSEYINRLL